ncbi:hypothetical protein WA588_000086 [Blastocystis sp. NMH]
MEYCAKHVVANWDNRKFRGDFLRRIHSANPDAIEFILETFRKEEKLSEGVLCQFLPSISYSLNLSGCNYLRNSVLRQISFYCKNLRILILDGCKQLSNYCLLSILHNCWKLQTLSLCGCFLITDGPFITSWSLFYGLHALYPLRKLSLSHCSQLSGEFAITVVKNCSQLRCLDISHCRHISQDALQKLFTITFSELDVSCIPALTDDSLRFFLPYCDFLTSLRMDHSAVSDELLAQLLRRCRRLVSLSVANSPGVGDRALMSLARHAVRLQRLTVDNDMITDAGIRAVLDALPIGYLSAAFCYQLTDEAFRNVDETMALKEVNVTWCEKLTDETFRRLQHCKRLTRVGMKGCRVSSPVIHQCEESGLTFF